MTVSDKRWVFSINDRKTIEDEMSALNWWVGGTEDEVSALNKSQEAIEDGVSALN